MLFWKRKWINASPMTETLFYLLQTLGHKQTKAHVRSLSCAIYFHWEFHNPECVDCAEKFPVSTANKIFLATSVSNANCMQKQRRWYTICACGLCVKLLKLKINVRLSAEICLPQRLSVPNEHALHVVQNLEIQRSVARHFARYGICMKYQRRWYKTCARGLCGQLLKLKISVRLSAESCPAQRLSVGKKHALHFVQNLEIPNSVA